MILNTDAIFYKCIDHHWHVHQGRLSDDYDDIEHWHIGRDCHTRDAAVAHAQAVAERLGIPESEIIEDIGARNY